MEEGGATALCESIHVCVCVCVCVTALYESICVCVCYCVVQMQEPMHVRRYTLRYAYECVFLYIHVRVCTDSWTYVCAHCVCARVWMYCAFYACALCCVYACV